MKLLLIALTLAAASVAATTVPKGADKAGGYYEYRTWQIAVDGDKYKQTEHVRLVILNHRGDQQDYLGVIQDKWHVVKNLKIMVYDRDGQLAYKRKMKDMTRACGFGASYALYQDICTYYIELPGPGYPYTIEYEYQYEVSSLFFLGEVRFQTSLPVVSASLDLKWPAGRELHYRAYDLDVKPTITPDGKTVHYQWAASNLPPVNDEDSAPVRYQMPGRIEFSADRFELAGFAFDDWSWNGVGRWYNQMAADRYLSGSAEPSASPPDPIAAIRAAYRRVVDNDRYVSVSIGVGGWQPHKAASIEKKAYGDCKDLSTLLISYLRQAGVKAYPVLVLTRDLGVIDPEFPMFRFNHVITAAETGNDTIWLDATCSDCPFGMLPVDDQNIDVLLMNDSGGTIVRTPATAPKDNAIVRTTHITVEPDRTYRAESRWRATGTPAVSYRYFFQQADRDSRRQALLGLLPDNGRGVQLTEFDLEPNDTAGGSVTITVRYKTTLPLDDIKGTWYLRPDLFGTRYGLMSIDLKDRSVPIDLKYPDISTDTILVTWAGCPVGSVEAPPDDSAACGELACRRSVESFPDSVRIEIERRCNAYELPVAAFDSLAQFRQAYGGFRNDAIKFRTASQAGN